MITWPSEMSKATKSIPAASNRAAELEPAEGAAWQHASLAKKLWRGAAVLPHCPSVRFGTAR